VTTYEEGYALGDPKRIPDQSFEPSTAVATIPEPDTLLDVRTGELVEATPAKAAELLVAAREMRHRILDLVKDCEAVLLAESRREGSKTLHFESGTATITGGSELQWNLDILLELRKRGLSEERYNELVTATVTYKVNAAIAKQLEAANPAYAEVIGMARSYVQKPQRVSVK
jgi:hypothetical protein